MIKQHKMKYLTRQSLSYSFRTHVLADITSAEQIEHFLDYGYLVIKNAFTKEKAAEWSENIWVRLDLDPDDKSTWDRERIHMPFHKREVVSTFAPKVNIFLSLLTNVF